MKRIFKYSFVLAVLSVVMPAGKARAQSDAQFSQFYANRLALQSGGHSR